MGSYHIEDNLKTKIYYNPDQDVIHDFISTRKIPEFVRQADRRSTRADSACIEDLKAVHDPRYVDDVVATMKPDGFGERRSDMVKYALGSCGNFISAATHAAEGMAPVVCSASQGFHHAHYDYAYGFCTFNALAAASVKLLQDAAVNNVLIIDGDGHKSDGTKNIITRLSLEHRIHVIDRDNLTMVTDFLWDDRMWEHYADYLIREFRPGIIMYQAGADAWVEDPYKVGYLSETGLRHRDIGIFRAADDHGVPVVWNLAGGYSDPMQKTIDIHLQTLKASDEVFYANQSIVSDKSPERDRQGSLPGG